MNSRIPNLPCLCGSLRRATRALTQVYEEALRPLGLSGTQFTILQVLAQAGDLSQGQLAGMLAMDSTTLTRTLAIMIRQGWVAERRGKDRRERRLRLSTTGSDTLQQALPIWEALQSRLRKKLGNRAWEEILRSTNQITNLAVQEGELA